MTDDPKADTRTSRDMCDAFEMTPRRLRLHHAREPLSPIRAGTRRWFIRRGRLRLILRGNWAVPLEDICQVREMDDREGSNAAQMAVPRAEPDTAIAELATRPAGAAQAGFRQAAADQDPREKTDAELHRPREGYPVPVARRAAGDRDRHSRLQ